MCWLKGRPEDQFGRFVTPDTDKALGDRAHQELVLVPVEGCRLGKAKGGGEGMVLAKGNHSLAGEFPNLRGDKAAGTGRLSPPARVLA